MDPFVNRRGTPVLVRCAVLFVDLLGVREMNASRRVATHLVTLDRAVSRMHRDFFGEASPYRAAFFSDTLVLAAPISGETDDATVVAGLVRQAAWLQNDLVAEGFFARGGLSLGRLHISDRVVFGPALVDVHRSNDISASSSIGLPFIAVTGPGGRSTAGSPSTTTRSSASFPTAPSCSFPRP
jgi:hypothetical protein